MYISTPSLCISLYVHIHPLTVYISICTYPPPHCVHLYTLHTKSEWEWSSGSTIHGAALSIMVTWFLIAYKSNVCAYLLITVTADKSRSIVRFTILYVYYYPRNACLLFVQGYRVALVQVWLVVLIAGTKILSEVISEVGSSQFLSVAHGSTY